MMNSHAPPTKRKPGGGRAIVESGDRTSANRSTEEPEHRNDRRRFLIWACMAGLVKPERVAERILADVESDLG